MLPRQVERLQQQLIRWGYSPRLVRFMEPWSLLFHFSSQKKKRDAQYASDSYDYSMNYYIDDEFHDNDSDSANDNYSGKYRGVIVPH